MANRAFDLPPRPGLGAVIFWLSRLAEVTPSKAADLVLQRALSVEATAVETTTKALPGGRR